MLPSSFGTVPISLLLFIFKYFNDVVKPSSVGMVLDRMLFLRSILTILAREPNSVGMVPVR